MQESRYRITLQSSGYFNRLADLIHSKIFSESVSESDTPCKEYKSQTIDSEEDIESFNTEVEKSIA